MVMPLVISEEHVGTVQSLPSRKAGDLLADANGASARHWRDRMLPRSFGAQAASRRNYRTRSKATTQRKKRDAKRGQARYNGNRALVHTGDLEDAMVNAKHSISTSRNQSIVKMNGPSYFRDQVADETTRVMPSESERLNNFANERLGNSIQKLKHRKMYRI